MDLTHLISIQEAYFHHLQCAGLDSVEEEGAGEDGGGMNWGRKAALVEPLFYLFQKLSVCHYSCSNLRALTH